MKINTERLEAIAASGELARAAFSDRDRFSQMLDAKIPEAWPPEIMADVMEFFAETLEKDPELQGWWAWYLILNQTNEPRTLIGCAGFNGYPDAEGKLTLGYTVLNSYQRRGYANEAVQGLIDWAFSHPQVTGVIAETFPELTPSIRIMEKNKMVLLGAGSEAGTLKYGINRLQFNQGKENR